MTVTSSENQARSHRLWAILVTLLAVATAGYFVWVFLFASIRLPTQYASVDEVLSADFPPIVDESFFAFEQETYKLLQDNREIAISDLLRVGNLTFAHGNPSRSSYYFKKALEMAREVNSDIHVIMAMNNLGVSETVRGDLSEAERNLLDAYELAMNVVEVRSGKKRLADQILLNLGWHFLQSGNYAEALRYFLEAEEIFTNDSDDFGLGRAWSGQGRAATGQMDFGQAIAYHQQALVVFSRMKKYRAQAGEVYYLAGAELAEGDFESARSTFSEAIQIYLDRAGDWVGALRGKAGIGRAVEASGDLYTAMRYATEVMDEFRDRGHRLGEALSRIEVARLAERRDRPEQAITHYTKVVQQLDAYHLKCRRLETTEALARLQSGQQVDNEIQ